MAHPLYDPAFDAGPPITGLHDWVEPGFLGWGVKGTSPSKGGLARRGAFVEWVSELSFAGLIGLGLASGLLVSIPVALALRASRADDSSPSTARPIGPPANLVRTRPVEGPTFPGPIAAIPAPTVTTPVAPALVPVVPASPALEAREPDEENVRRAIEIPPPVIGMKAVMDGVRRTAASTAWQRTGRADPGLMQSLEVIFREIRLATGDEAFRLPVRFGEVPSGLGDNPERVIHVAMNPARFDRSQPDPSPVVLNAGRASRSILIADGDIVLTSAEDCLILATGAVEVSYPTRCVVIAGRLIQASHDTASMLISGSQVSVSHSYAPTRPPVRSAMYSAPRLVTVSHASGVIFLNTGYRRVSHQSNCRPLDWPGLDFGDADREAGPPPWEGLKAPVLAVRSYRTGGVELRRNRDDVATRIELGSPILDHEARPVPEFAGWRAYRTTDDYIMMYKGSRLREFPLRGRGIGG